MKKLTVSQVAKESLKKANGNWEKATEFFKKVLNSNKDVYNELVTPLVDKAVWQAIRAAARQDRRQFKSERPVGADNTDGITQIARQHAKDWLKYPLHGGKPLGEATKADLLEEIAIHEHNVVQNQIMINFYTRILHYMGKKKYVKSALTSDEISEINSEVRSD